VGNLCSHDQFYDFASYNMLLLVGFKKFTNFELFADIRQCYPITQGYPISEAKEPWNG